MQTTKPRAEPKAAKKTRADVVIEEPDIVHQVGTDCHKWIVDVATGQFLRGGNVPPYEADGSLAEGQICAVLDRVPDRTLERYSGDPEAPIRWATDQEVSAARVEQLNLQATVRFAALDPLTLALVEWVAGKVGDEMPQALDQLKAIYAARLEQMT